MAEKDWGGFVGLLNARMAGLGRAAPQPMGPFHELSVAVTKDGALDSKTKELIGLAIGIATRCEGCLAYHANAAAKKGATRSEVLETIGVAIYIGGGQSVIYGAEALEAFDSLAAEEGVLAQVRR